MARLSSSWWQHSVSELALADTFPLNIDFVLDLPEELRDLFNDWSQRNGFVPTDA